jgi:hypothetical protein
MPRYPLAFWLVAYIEVWRPNSDPRSERMMVQTHWFREHPAVIRKMIGFLVITIVLCFLLGPTGILYAVGFEVAYLLTYLFMVAFATLLGPDVF